LNKKRVYKDGKTFWGSVWYCVVGFLGFWGFGYFFGGFFFSKKLGLAACVLAAYYAWQTL
jgi:dolichol kinase